MMNNLLKTISESPLKSILAEAELKLLLSSVRDVRSQDAKAAESFYGSLEGVLLELRTVTVDNRDAEAFLKPVSRMDYPDYYELIKHPMDLGTMLKHVKARKYKCKQEFATDLALIWRNCFKYNTGPDHVLRGCVTRLKRKADRLLAHVSDRPDRITVNGLSAPSASSSKLVKINGLTNGLTSGDQMVAADPPSPQADFTPNTPGPSHSRSKSPNSTSWHASPAKPSPSEPNLVSFEDQPALIRTPAAMSMFMELDREMQHALDGVADEPGIWPMMGFDVKGKGKETLQQRLGNFVDEFMATDTGGLVPDDDTDQAAEGYLKRKRPLNSQDQRKRPRLADSCALIDSTLYFPEQVQADLLNSWWQAACSSSLIVGGLPSLPQFDTMGDKKQKGHGIIRPSARAKPSGRRANNRKPRPTLSQTCTPTKSLLKLMNSNIATLGRVRRTHAKFVTLSAAADLTNPVVLAPEPASDHEADDLVPQEEGWQIQGEVGQQAAGECLTWMAGKVLQHAGFQGSSTTALSVLTSVTSEYLQNVGRTIRFLSDKYSNTMTPEEIILHTLFEGGTAEIQDLERYIKDDVVRYGGRLGDLEKKLVGAYRDVTTVEVPTDEGIFEDGDEADHFASGGLADILGGGEDFLGLRELGIEAEFGLKSLSIPKRLWKGKSDSEDRPVPDRESPGEPLLPFPPPPAFIPLDSSKVDSQIGLLKNFYRDRLMALAATSPTLPPPINPILVEPVKLPPASSSSSSSSVPLSSAELLQMFSMSIVLPDDPPNPARAKIGPLGQVIMTNPSAAANKKKSKAKDGATMDRSNDKDAEGTHSSPKKKEPKKKKLKDEQRDNTFEVEGNLAPADVNGTGPKRKSKSAGSGKKYVDGTNPVLDVPSAIIASA